MHEDLDFGQCHLALGVPMTGKFSNITTLQELRDMDCWTSDTPLRVVTGYHAIAKRFFQQHGFEHVALLTADGALEASPAMGCADIILDLVSTGGLMWVGAGHSCNNSQRHAYSTCFPQETAVVSKAMFMQCHIPT